MIFIKSELFYHMDLQAVSVVCYLQGLSSDGEDENKMIELRTWGKF